MKKCSICGQKADVFTQSHRKEPFVDGRNYECVCFTCYFVPKTLEQKYANDGSVSEETHLEYSCENLCGAVELHHSGASDTLRHAKICVESVTRLCSRAKGAKIEKKRPAPSWNIS